MISQSSPSLLPVDLWVDLSRWGVNNIVRGYSAGMSFPKSSNASICAVREAFTIPMPWYPPTHPLMPTARNRDLANKRIVVLRERNRAAPSMCDLDVLGPEVEKLRSHS